MEGEFFVAEIGSITPSPLNPRKAFSGQSFDELVKSVKQKGVLQPILIRPVEGKELPYEIVAGERRYRAALTAELTEIPTIMRELTDEEAYDFMLVENLHREDLTDREEAESFKAYVDRHGDDGITELAGKPAFILDISAAGSGSWSCHQRYLRLGTRASWPSGTCSSSSGSPMTIRS